MNVSLLVHVHVTIISIIITLFFTVRVTLALHTISLLAHIILISTAVVAVATNAAAFCADVADVAVIFLYFIRVGSS